MRLLRCATIGLMGFLLSATSLPSQTVPRTPASAGAEPDENRDQQIMERFKTVLEKTPRRGTALDRVYGYHVERGTLDSLLRSYRDRVAKDPKDGAAWLLLGLFEAQRGKDGEAVLALREAEKSRPDDALPAFYLGQALVLVGQPDAAAEAFERAVERKPLRADLLEIFQALGRVHQRAHRADKALAVWTRLEALFPDDLRVQEQIAAALAEEDQPAQALERYEKLSDRVTDSYRKIQLKLEVAGLKVKIGKGKEALADFESLLGKLDPDSWLSRDVRRKVEEVFLRKDDLVGLASYYEGWIAKTPDDIEAMTRLGRTYSQMGRGEDARKWLEKAVKLAPSRKELRLALIENLRQRGDIAGATTQFEMLAKNDPNDPDVIRDWGRMLLSDVSKPEAERKQAAANVWRRLVREDSKDPVSVAQAADLFRQAGLTDDAINFYRKAIELAPDSSQYREYLGEYYHFLKRPTDALATWRETVAGSARTAKNLGRLGEVMAGFGYRAEALEPLTEAIKLEPDDLDLRLKRTDVLILLDRPREADEELERCEKLALEEEQAEAVLTRRIKVYQAENRLAQVALELREKLRAASKPDPGAWTRLARFFEADGKPTDAVQAAAEATKADAKLVPAWNSLARLQEANGNLLAAADAYRTLVTLDRRSRTDYLTNIAKLEARLGRREEALKAGRDLLAAAPGNPDHDQFFADLCFSLNEPDEGLDALRRSVRANPSEPKIMITLAENLARLFRTDEAIELYWRAFAKTTDLESKLAIVAKLTDQYTQKNQFDRLIARIERELREQDRVREKALCLAQAHQASGDFGSARQELEKLLAAYPKDTVLLRQLSTLSENAGDAGTSAQYQKRINEIAPSEEGNTRLAMLYLRAGELDEAATLWTRSADDDKDPARVIASIDSLMNSGKAEIAARVIESRLRRDPKNWELLLRQAISLIDRGKTEGADAPLQAILDLRLDDDSPSAAALKARQKPAGPTANPGANTSAGRISYNAYNYPPVQYRAGAANQARRIVGLDPKPGGQMSVAQGWSPNEYAQARIVALAWKVFKEPASQKTPGFVAESKNRVEKEPRNARLLWDYFYTLLINRDQGEVIRVATQLADLLPEDPSSQYLYVIYNQNRQTNNRVQSYYNQNVRMPSESATPAESKAHLERMLRALRMIKRTKPSWTVENDAIWPLTALKESNRETEYRTLIDEMIAGMNDVNSTLQFANLLGNLKDADALQRLGLRYNAIRPSQSHMASNIYAMPEAVIVMRRMGILAEKHDFDAVLKALEQARVDRRLHRKTDSRFGASASARSQIQREGFNAQSWVSSTHTRNVQIDFTLNLEWLTPADLQILRNAYEIARDESAVDRLIKQLSDSSKSGPLAETLDNQVALTLVLWWENDHELALASLKKAQQMAPKDVMLSLALADMYSRMGDLNEALAVIDRVDAIDQDVMKKRETEALRIAARIGDATRARLASERLFGLRLDSQTQVELSRQMSQLGMYDMADAVLNRAQRDAGNRVATLVSLMYQFQNQGNVDQAVEAAYQILKQAPAAGSGAAGANGRNAQLAQYYANSQNRMNINFSGGNNPANDQNANYRRQALFVLSRAGRLRELIHRAEAQKASAPRNEPLIRTLIEYYSVDNRMDQVQKLQSELLAINPNDPRARIDAAIQLINSGSVDQGIKEVKSSLLADPGLLNTFSNQLLQLFQSRQRVDDYYDLLDVVDLSKLQQGWPLAQAAQLMINNPKYRDRGIALYGRVLKGFPNERWNHIYQLMNTPYYNEIPGLYEATRDYFFGRSVSLQTPWAWTDTVIGNRPNGKINLFVSGFIGAALNAGKGDELVGLLETEIKRNPKWLGGRTMIAVLALRSGKPDEAAKQIETLLAPDQPTVPPQTRAWLCDELEAGGLVVLAKRLSDRLVEDTLTSIDAGQYDVNQVIQTVQQLRSIKRADEADKILDQLARSKPIDQGQPEQTAIAYLQAVLFPVAQQYQSTGRMLDALKAYRRAQSLLLTTPTANRSNSDSVAWLQSISQAIDNLAPSLKPEDRSEGLAIILDALYERENELGMMVYISQLEQARLDSRLTNFLSSFTQVLASQKEIRKVVNAASAKHPDDLNLQIAATWLMVQKEPDSAGFSEGLKRLRAWTEAHPLPKVEGRPGNPKARQPFVGQLGLWLVAREGLKKIETRADAEVLAQRALAASLQLPSPSWRQALLREWGDIAIANGDKQTGERLWAELLDSISAPERRAAAGTGTESAPKGAFHHQPRRPSVLTASLRSVHSQRVVLAKQTFTKMAMPVPQGPATTNPESSLAPPRTTRQKFDQSLSIAVMAAEKGLNDLSMRAAREAFVSGPPLDLMATNDAGGNVGQPYVSASRSATFSQFSMPQPGWQDNGQTPIRAASIGAKLLLLERSWIEHGVPKVKVYEIVRDITLPPKRPGEVHVFSNSDTRVLPTNRPPNRPAGAGIESQLVRLAREANALDDLKTRLRERLSRPSGELNALVLLADVSRAENDPKATNDLLRRLGERLKVNTLQNTIELAIRTATPALENDATSDEAAKLLDLCLRNVQRTPGTSNFSRLGLALAHYEFRRKRPDQALARLEGFLDAEERIARRVRNNNATDVGRKSRIEEAANELVINGLAVDALALLGRVADLPDVGDRLDNGRMMAQLARRITRIPVSERYGKLRDWSLPTKTRRSVRLLTALVQDASPPAVFEPLMNEAGFSLALPLGPVPGMVSTQWLLVSAAQEAGKLDELAAAVRASAVDRVENADRLLMLIELVRGKPDSIAAIFEEHVKGRAGGQKTSLNMFSQGQPIPITLADVEIAALALNSKVTSEAAEKLIGRWVQNSRGFPQGQELKALLTARTLAQRIPGAVLPTNPGLPDWSVVAADGSGRVASTWAAGEGQVSRPVGGPSDQLIFRYPLTGTFDIEADVRFNGSTSGLLQFGSLRDDPFQNGPLPQPFGTDDGNAIQQNPNGWRVARPGEFNHVVIKVEPGRARLFLNSHLFREMKGPQDLHPWLRLFCNSSDLAEWRNLRIVGTPQIPRQIDLLKGLLAAVPSEPVGVKVRRANVTGARPETPPPSTTEAPPVAKDVVLAPGWASKDGEIVGGKVDSTTPIPMRLGVLFPLQDRDVVKYEFFYEQGKIDVHPMLGQLALLIAPEGVRIRWLSSSNDSFALDPSNSIPAPGGAPRLELKANAWNEAEVALVGNTLNLEINGKPVLAYPLPDGHSRVLGLYHDASKSEARARKLLLTGDWPATLPPALQKDMLATPAGRDPKLSAIADALVSEASRAGNISALIEAARTLEPEQRLATLERFVLPNPEHAAYRVNGNFSSRQQIESPAALLVETAGLAKQLDPLAKRIENSPASTPEDIRNRQSLLVLVHVARGDQSKASIALASLAKAYGERKPNTNPQGMTIPDDSAWPELLAARAASANPSLRPAALTLLDKILAPWADLEDTGDEFAIHVARTRTLVEQPDASTARFQWLIPISKSTTGEVGQGVPPAGWSLEKGTIHHIPGNGRDQLAFRIPLTGDFEATAELSTGSPLEETRLTFGGVWIGPRSDRKGIAIASPAGSVRDQSTGTLPKDLGKTYKYKLVLKNNRLFAYVNGALVGDQTFENPPYPWLAFEAPALSRGTIRGFAIAGKPQVVSTWEPLKNGILEPWTNFFRTNSGRGPQPSWNLLNEELTSLAQNSAESPEMEGSNFPNFTPQMSTRILSSQMMITRRGGMQSWDPAPTPGNVVAHVNYPMENLLRLNMPLQEGMVIAYESFFDPSNSKAHPTVGRTAYLLGPEGLATHEVTNAPFDRPRLDPQNRTPDPGPLKKPGSLALKPGTWNKVELALKSGKLTIQLNGVQVVERDISPQDDRRFGLFQYANEGTTRVRNVRVTGGWPSALPPSANWLETEK